MKYTPKCVEDQKPIEGTAYSSPDGFRCERHEIERRKKAKEDARPRPENTKSNWNNV